MKRVAITGDRDWLDDRLIDVKTPLATLSRDDDFVVLGDANGVDTLARRALLQMGWEQDKNFVVKRADWIKYHRAAGPIRNGEMLDELEQGDPEAEREVWWFHDNLAASKGTKNCVEQARKRGLRLKVQGWFDDDGSDQLRLELA